MHGAIAGPRLGEAAHRLVNNTLNLKANGSPSGGFSGQYPTMSRPAGPSGYERGFRQEGNYYDNNSFNPQGIMGRPRFPPPNGYQNERQNSRAPNQEQYRNMKIGMSSLDENSVRMGNPSQQYSQYTSPLPAPPSMWIDKPVNSNGGMYTWQQDAMSHEKPGKKVYQIKSRSPQDHA